MARRLALLAVSIFFLLLCQPSRGAEDPLKPESPDDYELHKLLVDAINQVEQNYVEPVDRRKLIEAAIRGVLSQLDDYSGYVAPERMSSFQTAVSQQFGGIGIQVGTQRGQLIVISPLVGSPAYRAGIIAGDRILEINGTSTKGISLDDAVELLKGETGTSVLLKVTHPGSTETEEISLTRQIIRLETVLGNQRGPDDQWDYMLDHDLRIGYVRLTVFGRDTADDLKKVLTELEAKKAAGLILDLRFNPGGLLSSAIQVSDLFVSEGRIVSTAGRNVKEQVWDAQKRGTFENLPLVVLINEYSASASEIVAACLQDHQRAVIVGQRSYGKGSVQRVIEMEGGQSALKLTTAGYRRPNGKNIDRHPGDTLKDEWGVKPDDGFQLALSPSETATLARNRRDRDILKKPTAATADSAKSEPAADAGPGKPPEDAEFVDRQLQRALDHLRGLAAGQVAKPAEAASEEARLAKAAQQPAEPPAHTSPPKEENPAVPEQP